MRAAVAVLYRPLHEDAVSRFLHESTAAVRRSFVVSYARTGVRPTRIEKHFVHHEEHQQKQLLSDA